MKFFFCEKRYMLLLGLLLLVRGNFLLCIGPEEGPSYEEPGSNIEALQEQEALEQQKQKITQELLDAQKQYDSLSSSENKEALLNALAEMQKIQARINTNLSAMPGEPQISIEQMQTPQEIIEAINSAKDINDLDSMAVLQKSISLNDPSIVESFIAKLRQASSDAFEQTMNILIINAESPAIQKGFSGLSYDKIVGGILKLALSHLDIIDKMDQNKNDFLTDQIINLFGKLSPRTQAEVVNTPNSKGDSLLMQALNLKNKTFIDFCLNSSPRAAGPDKPALPDMSGMFNLFAINKEGKNALAMIADGMAGTGQADPALIQKIQNFVKALIENHSERLTTSGTVELIKANNVLKDAGLPTFITPRIQEAVFDKAMKEPLIELKSLREQALLLCTDITQIRQLLVYKEPGHSPIMLIDQNYNNPLFTSGEEILSLAKEVGNQALQDELAALGVDSSVQVQKQSWTDTILNFLKGIFTPSDRIGHQVVVGDLRFAMPADWSNQQKTQYTRAVQHIIDELRTGDKGSIADLKEFIATYGSNSNLGAISVEVNGSFMPLVEWIK